MGYHRAGFEVVGVDIKPQPNYPFDFLRYDAIEALKLTNWVMMQMSSFDVIHASPPCQTFTRAKHLRDAQGSKTQALDLLELTRQLLIATGKPYIIENVPGAPLLNPVTICGSAFGLKVRRHRCFESNIALFGTTCDHRAQGRPVGVYHVMNDNIPKGGRTAKTLEEGQAAMGIDWMNWNELKESIPPAYTEFLGKQLWDRLVEGEKE